MVRKSGNKNIPPEKRKIVVKLVKDEMSVRKYAKLMQTNHSTIYNWLSITKSKGRVGKKINI